jgi:hypothetical protein
VQLLRGRVQALIDRGKGEGDFGLYGSTTITAVKGTDYEMTRDEADEVQVDVNEGRVDAAELKNEDAAEAEAAMKSLIMGLIGMTIMEGQRVRVPRGERMGRPERVPRVRRESGAVDGERGGRSGHEAREPRGGREPRAPREGREPRAPRERGGRSGSKGGGGAPGVPSLPGLPF